MRFQLYVGAAIECEARQCSVYRIDKSRAKCTEILRVHDFKFRDAGSRCGTNKEVVDRITEYSWLIKWIR